MQVLREFQVSGPGTYMLRKAAPMPRETSYVILRCCHPSTPDVFSAVN